MDSWIHSESVFGQRHLVCDGPLNGQYVEAGFGPDLEPAMLDVSLAHQRQYELGEWPTGELVWMLAPAWMTASLPIADAPLANLIQEAVNDCEVR